MLIGKEKLESYNICLNFRMRALWCSVHRSKFVRIVRLKTAKTMLELITILVKSEAEKLLARSSAEDINLLKNEVNSLARTEQYSTLSFYR